MNRPAVEAMWRDYTAATGASGPYDVWAFGHADDPRQQTELALLVRDGPKRATAGRYAEFLDEDEPLPKSGDHSVILDGGGSPVCIIRASHVEVVRFGSVGETFAWMEGEGDRTLASWRDGHRDFFERVGTPIDDDTLMVLMQFDLVWPVAPAVPSDAPGDQRGSGFALVNVDGRAAVLRGDDYFDLDRVSSGQFSSDPMVAIERSAELRTFRISGEPDGTVTGRRLGPPVPRPRQVFGVGLNYRGHISESGLAMPSEPLIFAKFSGSVAGPTDEIVMHSETVDYEGELVVVIGQAARTVAADDAWDYVAGLTVGQDFSDRSLQFRSTPPQFSLGKSFDGFAPIGPAVVSVERIEMPLVVETRVNGETRQRAGTDEHVFPVEVVIEYLSAVLTLYPGDLIFMGTPAGTGYPDGPYLRHGDVVTTTIPGIGSLSNRCVSADLI